MEGRNPNHSRPTPDDGAVVSIYKPALITIYRLSEKLDNYKNKTNLIKEKFSSAA
jgi:hypothetical protein